MVGSEVRRPVSGDRLSHMIDFGERRRLARAHDGRTVSNWIERLIDREIEAGKAKRKG
jgi:hypothetical protein